MQIKASFPNNEPVRERSRVQRKQNTDEVPSAIREEVQDKVMELYSNKDLRKAYFDGIEGRRQQLLRESRTLADSGFNFIDRNISAAANFQMYLQRQRLERQALRFKILEAQRKKKQLEHSKKETALFNSVKWELYR